MNALNPRHTELANQSCRVFVSHEQRAPHGPRKRGRLLARVMSLKIACEVTVTVPWQRFVHRFRKDGRLVDRVMTRGILSRPPKILVMLTPKCDGPN